MLTAAGSHPNLVPFRGWWRDAGGVLCLLLGHCEGGTLAALLKVKLRSPALDFVIWGGSWFLSGIDTWDSYSYDDQSASVPALCAAATWVCTAPRASLMLPHVCDAAAPAEPRRWVGAGPV